jgi:hypothetical protein
VRDVVIHQRVTVLDFQMQVEPMCVQVLIRFLDFLHHALLDVSERSLKHLLYFFLLSALLGAVAEIVKRTLINLVT